MSPKILVAFAAGVAASGAIFFLASRSGESSKPVQQAAPAVVRLAEAKAPAVQAVAPEEAKPRELAPIQAETRPAKRAAHRWPAAAKALAGSVVIGQAQTAPASALPATTSPAAAPVVPQTESAKPVDAQQAEPAKLAEVATKEQIPLTPAPGIPASAVSVAPLQKQGAATAEPRTVTLPGGTLVTVRLAEALSTQKNKSGDAFRATLDQPVIVDGLVIAERGSAVDGRVVEAEKAGKTKGVSRLQLELTRFTSSDGQMVGVRTATVDEESKASGSAKSDAAKVAVGSAAGAVLGGILGGGKGAGIGAASGGAAAGAVVLATRGKPLEVPAETRLTFRLSEPVVITERLNQ